MDNNFGKMIYDGKIIDLNKAEEEELKQIIDKLQNEQIRKKNKLKNILEKMSEGM